MKRLLPFGLVLLVVGALFAGSGVRSQIGVDYRPESLQNYFLGLGMFAPAIFLAIVTFRQFLLLPSMLLLTVGGLVFGAVMGTVLGGVGITLSGLFMFALGRGLGRRFVEDHLSERFRGIDRQIDSAGPLLIALTTAHPMGPMTPFHSAAGISSIRLHRFFIALVLAAFLRAFAYSFFGATLFEIGSREFYIATFLLLIIALLPFAHPTLRQKILGRRTN